MNQLWLKKVEGLLCQFFLPPVEGMDSLFSKIKMSENFFLCASSKDDLCQYASCFKNR